MEEKKNVKNLYQQNNNDFVKENNSFIFFMAHFSMNNIILAGLREHKKTIFFLFCVPFYINFKESRPLYILIINLI